MGPSMVPPAHPGPVGSPAGETKAGQLSSAGFGLTESRPTWQPCKCGCQGVRRAPGCPFPAVTFQQCCATTLPEASTTMLPWIAPRVPSNDGRHLAGPLCAVTIAPPPADHFPHHLATLWNSELGIFSNIRTLAPAVRCIDPVRRHSLTAMNDGGHPSTADRRPLRTIYPPPWPRPGRCHWILAGASSEPYTSSLIDI